MTLSESLTARPNPVEQFVPRSVYIHVPFCERRCGYCDFSIIAGRNELVPRYLRALTTELNQTERLQIPSVPLKTLYIGGGTPTLLAPVELAELLEILRSQFVIDEETEFTFEANPDGLTLEKQDLLQAAGVNRISLGVQTFDNQLLQLLERTHTAEQTETVIEQIATRFPNFSLDLIFGIPGQSQDLWEQTVQKALSWSPMHISTYALTFEKGTRFWTQRHQGQLLPVADSLETAMYEWTREFLPAVGFEQYEISNFAQPGFHSRHNEAYWTGQSYLAFGPGASRFVNGVRSTNHRSSYTWMSRLERGESAVDLVDDLTPEERARELLAIGLRRTAGVNKQMIKARTGCQVETLLENELSELKRQGWLQETDTALQLTPAGQMFADWVASEVI